MKSAIPVILGAQRSAPREDLYPSKKAQADSQKEKVPTGQSMKNTIPVILGAQRSAPREDLDPNKKAQADSHKEKAPTGQASSIEAMLRTPPHLMNQRNANQFNINKSNHITFTRVAPPRGTGPYLYVPTISSSAAKTTSAHSSSLDKSGTHMAHDTPSEHQRLFLGESNFTRVNLKAASHQLPNQLPSVKFYLAVPHMNSNHSGYQQPPQYHCDWLGRKEQQPLPSYQSSQDDAHIRPISSSVLGKRPVTTNPAWSSFQSLPLDASDDMALAYGPQCELHTDDLLSLVQSIGTPEFVANSEKVLRSGSSLYEPCHVDDASLAPVNSSTVSAPSLHLSLGTGNGDDKGKGKGKGKVVSSYWDLSAMTKTMESMKKQRQEYLPVRMLGSDGQGCSNNTMHRRP